MTASLSPIVAALSFAGGLIHFAVIRHHLEFAAIAGGFAVMGGAQWSVAVRMLVRPSASTRRAVVAVHVAIVALWVMSRTVGLVVVPGAEAPSRAGLADLTAAAFSIAVIVGVAAVRRAGRNSERSRAGRTHRGLAVAVGLAVLALAAPAALADHDHHLDHSPAPASPGHDHGGHADHQH